VTVRRPGSVRSTHPDGRPGPPSTPSRSSRRTRRGRDPDAEPAPSWSFHCGTLRPGGFRQADGCRTPGFDEHHLSHCPPAPTTPPASTRAAAQGERRRLMSTTDRVAASARRGRRRLGCGASDGRPLARPLATPTHLDDLEQRFCPEGSASLVDRGDGRQRRCPRGAQAPQSPYPASPRRATLRSSPTRPPRCRLIKARRGRTQARPARLCRVG